MTELTQADTNDQASDLHVTTASQDLKSMLHQEFEVLGDKVLGISGGDIQIATTEEETVLKDGQVLGLTNEEDPCPAVHTKHYASDLSLKCLNTAISQKKPSHMPFITSQFNQCLSGGEDNSSAFIVDSMITEDKSHLVEHSVEDLVHAEILMSLKTGLTAGETELSSDMEETLPELPSNIYKSICEDFNDEQSTDGETEFSSDMEETLPELPSNRDNCICEDLNDEQSTDGETEFSSDMEETLPELPSNRDMSICEDLNDEQNTDGETELSSDMEETLPELPSNRDKSICEDLNDEQSTDGETEFSSDMEETLPELTSNRDKSICEDLNDDQSTDGEGTGVTEGGSNALSDVQKRQKMAMCRALEYVLADLKEMYEASPSLYPFRVISGRSYTRDVYLAAMADRGRTKYTCGICGKNCADRDSLCPHMKSPKTPLLYKCEVCEKEFQYSSSLKLHIKMHKIQDASTARYSNTDRHTYYSDSSAEKGIYECKVCGKRLRRGDKLKVHLQSHQSKTCRICMKEFSNLSYHMRQHLENKMSRMRHRTRNETEKCTKNDHFGSPQYLSVSTNPCHNCFGRLQCPSCRKSFPSRHQLQVHVVSHSEPRFKCLTCDQEFYRKYQLQLHQISHTGLPRHVCRRCNQSFLFSFSLRMHMRIHTSVRLMRRMVKPFV